jgi:hypothetical protein
MNATRNPPAFGSDLDATASPGSLAPSSTRLRQGLSKIALILGGFTAMGYLLALSFFRLG